MVRDLIKNRVCELESQAMKVADASPTYSKQLMHAAREMDSMQLQVFLLLSKVWDDSCSSVIAELEGHVATPSLPQLTPLSKAEVVTD